LRKRQSGLAFKPKSSRGATAAIAAATLSACLGACSAQVPAAFDAVVPSGGGPAVRAGAPPASSTTAAATIPPATSSPVTAEYPTTSVAPTAGTTAPSSTTTLPPEPTSTSVLTSTTLPPAPRSFGDGTHIVGVDIQVGRYEALEPGADCSWQRLSGFSGEYRDVLADGNPRYRAIVDVLADDAAMVTSGCGTWTGFQPFDEPLTEFGPGTWAIGEQILPGTYSAPGGAGCFWATVTGFDGSQASISAIARPEPGPVVVTLTTDNTGIVSDNCGNFSQSG